MHSRLPRGVRPRLEGKQRTALSSRAPTRISWSPLSRLKGIHPTLQFGERTRDCTPGQAGKEGPQLARTGASQGFPRAAAPMGVFSRGTTRISGSLSCGTREARSACARRGGARHCSLVQKGTRPQGTLKKDYRGLSRVAAGNPHFTRLLRGPEGTSQGGSER